MAYIKTWAAGDQVLGADLNANYAAIGAARFITLTAGEAITAGNSIALGPYQADGGIKYDTSTGADWNNPSLSGTSITFNITVGNNSNRGIFLIMERSTSGAAGTITVGGSAVTAITSVTYSSSVIETYYYLAPATGSVSISATSLTNGQSYRLYAYSYYNVAQSSPISASNVGQNVAFVSVTPGVDGCLVFGVCNSGITATLTSSFTQHVTSAQSGNNLGSHYMGDSGVISPIASTTFTMQGAVNTLLVFAIKPFSAPTTGGAFKASSAANNNLVKSFIGFANNTVAAGGSVDVIVGGIVTLSGLSAYSQYYLNDTAGTIGTSAGTNSRKAGVALNTTQLLVTNIW